MSAAKKIRIGTRASRLALLQAEEIKNLLLKTSPDISESNIKIIHFTTSGDKISDRSLAQIGGKGLFVKELEEALLNDKIDVAVHSAKDVPPSCPQGLVLSAFTSRRDVRDAFISAQYSSIDDLPLHAEIGTTSARRKAFLLKMRPDLAVVHFRGNIDTRLRRIERNLVDGAILAVAGLQRSDLQHEIKQIIEPKDMLPSGGQGCLALQTRENDEEIYALIRKINHVDSEIAVSCERAFLSELGASCISPVGAFAEIVSKKLHLKFAIIDFEGEDSYESESFTDVLTLDSAIELGKKAAKEVKDSARELLERIV